MKQSTETKVSIRARGNKTSNKPSYFCKNCECYRYNPCGCKVADGVEYEEGNPKVIVSELQRITI